jgi:quercetin dioxygenase-like cupin family protein
MTQKVSQLGMPNDTTVDDSPFAGQLVETVTYQADAIVSKVLGKARGGNATMFAFASGQELSEHTAPSDALIYIAEGEAEVRAGDETQTVGTGELVRLPANLPHAIRATTDFKMLLVILRDATR